MHVLSLSAGVYRAAGMTYGASTRSYTVIIIQVRNVKVDTVQLYRPRLDPLWREPLIMTTRKQAPLNTLENVPGTEPRFPRSRRAFSPLIAGHSGIYPQHVC